MSSETGDSSSELNSLQENLSAQQAKIAALKELVRQSEVAQGKKAAHAKEKVKNIAQRLSHLKSKATNTSQALDCPMIEESQEVVSTRPQSRSETPGSEKIQLLRRQMEENRQRMAERESSKRDIEEMVTQLKAKFDTTQQSLERSTELGRSMGDLSILAPTPSRPDTPAHSVEAELRRKIRSLETEVEKYRENATHTSCNHTGEIQQLQHRILDLEENLREKESVIDARTQAVTLMSESLSQKTHSTVNMLEDTKQEMFKMQEAFVEKENQLNGEIAELRSQLEEKVAEVANLQEVTDILETTRYDLTVKNAELSAEGENVTNLQAKIKQMEEEIERLHALLPSDDSGQSSEEFLAKFRANEEKIHQLEESLMQKTVECNVLAANFSVLQEKVKATGPKPLFASDKGEAEDQEAAKLKAQLDEANKSQIKMKLKMKQLQKQVEGFKKMSDVHQKVLQLSEENERLKENVSQAGEGQSLALDDAEASKKLKTLETTCQNQVAAIQLLEEQKIDLVDQMGKVRDELDALKTAPVRTEPAMGISVSSQINSIELEETIEQYAADKESLVREVESLIEKNEELRAKMGKLDEEKQELVVKLEQLNVEKQELLEKIDKLSIKNVSSVESLEIVENLTQQEQLEMEQQETGLIGEELSDSLMKLREESSELMNKIEMFTSERQEMHQQYVEKIDELEKQLKEAESERDALREKTAELENFLKTSQLSVENVENQLQLLRSEFNGKLDENHNLSVENGGLREKLAKLENMLGTLEEQGSDGTDKTDRIAFLEMEVSLKNDTIDTVNRQIMDLYASLEEKNSQILDKDDEITYLRDLQKTTADQLHQSTHGSDQLKRLIDQLRRQLGEVEQNNARVANATDDVKIGLEKRIQELEDKLMDSEVKRREQLEKLKKFAANLKKKTQQCTDLEAEVIKRSEETDAVRKDYEECAQKLADANGEKENLKVMLENLSVDIERMRQVHQSQDVDLSRQIQSLQNEVVAREKMIQELHGSLAQPHEVEKWENIAKEKENMVLMLQAEIESLRQSCQNIDSLKEEIEKLKKVLEETHMTYQEHAKQAQEAFNEEEQRYQEKISSLEAKITEHLMYIEDKESENASLSLRIDKLEEGISFIEARRNSLEKKNNILGDQLRQSQEEFSENEDKLLQRLATLSANDEIIAEKLQNTHAEKMELMDAIAELKVERAALENRLQMLDQEKAEACKKAEMQESEYNFLSQQIESQKVEMRKVQEDFERKVREKGQELDDLEVESSNQLQKMEAEKKSLQESLERTKDANSELQDEIMNLRENVNSLEQIRNDLERDYSWAKMQNETLTHDQLETQELRMQVVQDQTEIENLRQENQALRMTHESEVNSLKSLLDKVMVEKENLEADVATMKTQAAAEPDKVSVENLEAEAGAMKPPDACELDKVSVEKENLEAVKTRLKKSLVIPEPQVLEAVKTKKKKTPAIPEPEVIEKEQIEVVDEISQNIPSFIGAKFFAEITGSADFFDQATIPQPPAANQKDDYEGKAAVVEELIIPKTAYLCHPKPEAAVVDLGGGQEEEGWGWNAEEAALEQEHQNRAMAPPSLHSQSSDIYLKMQICEDRIRYLEDERDCLKNEITQSRQRSEKMLKKLKEYRSKCENLERSSRSSLDLDLTIQEELKEQVRYLETTLAAERKQMTTEVEIMAKKVDLLITTNEKMTDMKEDQDAQIEMYRDQIRELTVHIQVLEKKQNDGWNRVDDEEDMGEVNREMRALEIQLLSKEEHINQLTERICRMEREADNFIKQIDQFRIESSKIKDLLDRLTTEHMKLITQNAGKSPESAKLQEMHKLVQQLQEERNILTKKLGASAEQAQSLDELTAELEALRQEKVAREAAAQETNRRWQQALEERGNSIAESWKAHLATVEADFAAREEAFRQQIEQFQQTQQTTSVQEAQPKEETPELAPEHVPAGIAEMMANMQNALESQELELVTLKEQLAIRSAEYAALSAQLDPFGHSATSNMALVQPKIIKTPPAASGEIPPRTDLDMALYALHQRDMRCEELTLELTRLLEERDTLQLKLSSAIRQVEGMKSASSPEGSPVASGGASTDGGSHLSEKISELQSVSHARDKSFHEERQQRHKQMSWFWSSK
ncbi:protein lava lamp-like [Phlebotomus argentipes]|uniref:protein lava lamp-like n=1 Tax=Phlebotomus argentipes TaxID=94469 RepID=UPI0028934C4B|nr:protein lava lamp-like [Phlebotomus argentipes]